MPEGSVGDCLLSNYEEQEFSMDMINGEDQDQLDIIEEMIKHRLDQITDIKQLNKL